LSLNCKDLLCRNRYKEERQRDEKREKEGRKGGTLVVIIGFSNFWLLSILLTPGHSVNSNVVD
jgi:hypothetical protein